MKNINPSHPFKDKGVGIFQRHMMSVSEFSRLSSFIFTHFGIKLPPSKKSMLEGRLHKRLSLLKINSFKEYCDYIFSPEGQEAELPQMINQVTTNKTDFFREAVHFDFLSSEVVATNYRNFSSLKPFRVWSAACSSGQEPYTIAMVLADCVQKHPGFDYEIFATDISTRMLDEAAMAVYSEEKALPIPMPLRKKYLLRSKNPVNKTVRIVPELRARVKVQWFNLIEGDMKAYQDFDAIFCRNVLIYFDRPTQEKVVVKLCSKLEKGGYLFLGHSESIVNMKLPLQQVKPTIFKKI